MRPLIISSVRTFLVSLALFHLAVCQARAIVYIDIYSPGFRPLPLAIANVLAEPGSACSDTGVTRGVAEVLAQDLEISGIAQILKSETFVVQEKDLKLHPEPVDYKAWSLIGAQALILVRVSCSGSDEVSIDGQLFDVLQGKLIVWKKYRAQRSLWRRLTHRFADEILEYLTGRKGGFQSQIAYISDASGSKELYVMDCDGYGPRRLTNLHSICLVPAWSPKGTQIAFTSYVRRFPGIYIFDIQQSKVYQLLAGFSNLMTGPAWSPQADEIAFAANVKGNTELFTVGLSQSKPVRLTDNWSIDVSPSWSPDGKSIVFVSDRGGHPDLYILKVGEGNARRLTFEGNYNAEPSWSPTGDWIAYASQVGGVFQIFRIRPDGSGRTQLTSGPTDSNHPTWSPDGRLIAFSTRRLGNYNIHLVRFDGTGERRLTKESHNASDPTWSPSME